MPVPASPLMADTRTWGGSRTCQSRPALADRNIAVLRPAQINQLKTCAGGTLVQQEL